MKRYIFPVTIFGLFFTALWGVFFLWIPPVNGLVVAAFLIFGGLALASWGALGIYYLRRIWGPKDSPRFLLRRSLRQGFFLGVAAVGFLLLQLFGATNLVTLAVLVGIVFFMERLS